jgi:hypothetical protein
MAGPADGKYYILDGLKPVECEFVTWMEWSNETGGSGFEVASTRVRDPNGKEYGIITAFRGIGNSLYATVIFPNHECAKDMGTYNTLIDAKHGHQEHVIRLVRSGVFQLVDQE